MFTMEYITYYYTVSIQIKLLVANYIAEDYDTDYYEQQCAWASEKYGLSLLTECTEKDMRRRFILDNSSQTIGIIILITECTY